MPNDRLTIKQSDRTYPIYQGEATLDEIVRAAGIGPLFEYSEKDSVWLQFYFEILPNVHVAQDLLYAPNSQTPYRRLAALLSQLFDSLWTAQTIEQTKKLNKEHQKTKRPRDLGERPPLLPLDIWILIATHLAKLDEISSVLLSIEQAFAWTGPWVYHHFNHLPTEKMLSHVIEHQLPLKPYTASDIEAPLCIVAQLPIANLKKTAFERLPAKIVIIEIMNRLDLVTLARLRATSKTLRFIIDYACRGMHRWSLLSNAIAPSPLCDPRPYHYSTIQPLYLYYATFRKETVRRSQVPWLYHHPVLTGSNIHVKKEHFYPPIIVDEMVEPDDEHNSNYMNERCTIWNIPYIFQDIAGHLETIDGLLSQREAPICLGNERFQSYVIHLVNFIRVIQNPDDYSRKLAKTPLASHEIKGLMNRLDSFLIQNQGNEFKQEWHTNYLAFLHEKYYTFMGRWGYKLDANDDDVVVYRFLYNRLSQYRQCQGDLSCHRVILLTMRDLYIEFGQYSILEPKWLIELLAAKSTDEKRFKDAEPIDYNKELELIDTELEQLDYQRIKEQHYWRSSLDLSPSELEELSIKKERIDELEERYTELDYQRNVKGQPFRDLDQNYVHLGKHDIRLALNVINAIQSYRLTPDQVSNETLTQLLIAHRPAEYDFFRQIVTYTDLVTACINLRAYTLSKQEIFTWAAIHPIVLARLVECQITRPHLVVEDHAIAIEPLVEYTHYSRRAYRLGYLMSVVIADIKTDRQAPPFISQHLQGQTDQQSSEAYNSSAPCLKPEAWFILFDLDKPTVDRILLERSLMPSDEDRVCRSRGMGLREVSKKKLESLGFHVLPKPPSELQLASESEPSSDAQSEPEQAPKPTVSNTVGKVQVPHKPSSDWRKLLIILLGAMLTGISSWYLAGHPGLLIAPHLSLTIIGCVALVCGGILIIAGTIATLNQLFNETLHQKGQNRTRHTSIDIDNEGFLQKQKKAIDPEGCQILSYAQMGDDDLSSLYLNRHVAREDPHSFEAVPVHFHRDIEQLDESMRSASSTQETTMGSQRFNNK